ncbi:MAG: IS66 family insertion sequence element accessory protein TnpB [Myxococcales bacterium]|nr:IS66 family insertion sequence element accessory protein TnpB [Myxococcales bacterium]
MIPHGVEIYVGPDPIDLRWGFDRLRGVVGERVGRDARGGSLFVFFGRRRDAPQGALLRWHRHVCSTSA